MEYQLKFEPTQRRKGVKYKPILITDILLHIHKRPTISCGKKIKKSFETGTPGRIYGPIAFNNQSSEGVETEGNIKFILDMLLKDQDFIKYVMEEREKGCEVTIQIPRYGVPVSLGNDTNDFINSKHGQRVLRRLAKNKENSV